MTPVAPPLELQVLVAAGPLLDGIVTHYGESYAGLTLACGDGVYAPDNPAIIAIGPDRERDWPCGTLLQLCGTEGCILGWRQDSCPGCRGNVMDISEAGIAAVCGPEAGVCEVTVQAMRWAPAATSGPEPDGSPALPSAEPCCFDELP